MERWGEKVAQQIVASQTAKQIFQEARMKLADAQGNIRAIEEAQVIAQVVAQDIQEKAHSKISSVVSRCLSSVFEEPYEFKILFERKRGRTEAQLIFERDGQQVDPMTAAGGGPVDLAAFALRLSCLILRRPKLHRVVVMDEPFKSPSPHYRGLVRQLLAVLSEEMGVQFIMVTNIMELVAGDVVEL